MTARALEGRTALVTGGSRGIGAAICRHLAGAGARVVVNYHQSAADAERLVATLHAEGAEVVALRADIAFEGAAEQLVRDTLQAFGTLDILVNNAGYESTHAALELPLEEWDRVMNVNLRGAFLCARAAARAMIEAGRGGVIVNNSSIHEAVPRLGLVHYCCAKAGLEMLTKGLALEWAEYGLRVVGVSPGAIETDMNSAEIAAFGRERFEGWIPAGRLGTVDDVAAAVTFLATDAASYITGTTLQIDGAYALNLVRYDPRTKRHGGTP
jgi:glucose 1-dehydrogenase/3-dehydrosphinganine reductase